MVRYADMTALVTGMRHGIRVMLAMLFVPACLQAEAEEWKEVDFTVRSEAVVSAGSHAPFWQVSNRHGLSSLESNNADLRIGMQRDFDKCEGFSWAYGAELVGAWNHAVPFFVHQLYADMRYNCWELSVGSKERWSEGKHATLSGGGLTFSPNARPVPQVRLGIHEYTTVPWGFNGWVHVKGHFSYGRYTDSEYTKAFAREARPGTFYVQEVLLHEKTFFVKVGKSSCTPLSLEAGLEMYCQFGGKLFEKTASHDSLVYALPHTYREYVKAFIPLSGGKDTPVAEQTNVNGNQLGSWHIAANYTTPALGVKVYCEHFFEDHSQLIGFAFNKDWKGGTKMVSYLPWKDGLWGIEVSLPQCRYLSAILYEHTTMKDQSGPILHNSSGSLAEQVSGFDCYYHHYIYQGWQHWGRGMGTPLAISSAYNVDGTSIISSSRIKAHHLGAEGVCGKHLSYRLLATYVKHWGTYRDPFKEVGHQVSTLLELQYTIPTSRIGGRLSLAKDWGNTLIGNNTGAALTIQYTPTL